MTTQELIREVEEAISHFEDGLLTAEEAIASIKVRLANAAAQQTGGK